MFSNMADSSKAGFMVALSTNASACVEISANFRNQRIFCLMSCLERSMVSLVSISYAQRLSTPATGVGLPYTSWPSRPLRLCTGLVEARIVRLPWRASCKAVTPAITVLPTPPLPPKKVNLNLGCAAMYSSKECVISPMAPSLCSVAVHDAGQFFDHLQPGDVPFHLGDVADHLLAEGAPDLVKIAALHLEPILQVWGNVLAGQLRRQDSVDDIAGDRYLEFCEQLCRLLRVEDDHLLGHYNEVERGLLLVGQDVRRLVDAGLDIPQFIEDLVFLGGLFALQTGDHLLVLAHLLAELGDAVDPLVVHLGHGQVIERVPQRHQVVDVIVVIALDDDIDDGIEDGRLFHGRLGRSGLNVILDFVRHLVEAVHIEDLLADLLLVFLDVGVGVDLLS